MNTFMKLPDFKNQTNDDYNEETDQTTQNHTEQLQ